MKDSTGGESRPCGYSALDISKLIEAAQPVEAAKAAIRLGLSPVPLNAIGEKGSSGGKKPVENAWQKSRHTLQQIDYYFMHPGRGVGLLLGKQGKLIDIEVDAGDDAQWHMDAESDLLELCGGEIVDTAGWNSGRGRHRLFLWNPILDGVSEVLKDARKAGLKADSCTVHHFKTLEIRLGIGGGAQSAIPPTKHVSADRVWTGPPFVQMLPDAAATAIVESIRQEYAVKIEAAQRAAQAAKNRSAQRSDSGWSLSREEEVNRKRIEGFVRQSCAAIKAATAGDRKTGRYPTARDRATTTAGFVAWYGLRDMDDWCKASLLGAYLEAKPDAAGDYQEARPITAGWAYGLARPHQLHERDYQGPGPRPAVNGHGYGHAHAKPEQTRPAEAVTITSESEAANVDSILAAMKERRWLWGDLEQNVGWIIERGLHLVEGKEGTGKTRWLLDLCRRWSLDLHWPDGTKTKVDPDAKILFVASDSHWDQIATTAVSFGIPSDNVIFTGPREDMYNYTSIDDPQTLAMIRLWLGKYKIAMVVIDTLMAASVRPLVDPQEVAKIAGPLRDIAREFGVPVVMVGHLNSQGETWGRAMGRTCDNVIRMEADEQDEQLITIKSVKARWNRFALPTIQGRQGESGWEYSVVSMDSAGGNGAPSPRGRAEAQLAIRHYISTCGRSSWSEIQADLQEQGFSEPTVRRALKFMAGDGTLISWEEEGKKAKKITLYDLSPTGSVSGSKSPS